MESQTFEQIMQQYNLEWLRDWQIRQVLHSAYHNENDAAIILSDITGFHRNDKSPVWLEYPSHQRDGFVQELKALFDKGYQLILETKSNHGDDGGTVYMAYLCSEDTYAQYWNWRDRLDPEIYSGLSSELIYITNHPAEFIAVWAGPH